MGRPNFFNENRARAYPFTDTTAGVNVPESGPLTMLQLPDDWIVDCGFILGPQADYDSNVHSVYLQQVARTGDTVLFEFGCDAPGTYGHPLRFHRDVTDEDYSTEHLEGDLPPDASQSFSNPDEEGSCEEPLWYGFLTTGRMASLAARLADGESIVRAGTAATVEPALIQDLTAGFVSSVNLANDDRTRVTGAVDCPDPVWPFEPALLFISARCLRGDVFWRAGYNAVILQDGIENGLVFQAAVNTGDGEPCDEVPLFPGEAPPDGSGLLSGGLLCNETLRSINGVGGPLFEIHTGTGVIVTADPENNRLVVDVNLVELSNCFGVSEVS